MVSCCVINLLLIKKKTKKKNRQVKLKIIHYAISKEKRVWIIFKFNDKFINILC